MRRLIDSHPGKAICAGLILALVIPFLTFASVVKATAQVETQPTWAVVEFQNLSPKGGAGYGKVASDAVSSELAKTNKYALESPETVSRKMTELGYPQTGLRPDQLVRLGQNIPVTTIVSGQIVDWQVISAGGGKQADVLLRVEVRDVASGLMINGAALKASSSIRGGEVSDETLVNEAIGAGAFQAVADIIGRQLPRASVLNTIGNTALINRGSRSGFKADQEVVVTRGREQVAAAVVREVNPDDSIIAVTRPIKGIQPGDKVQVIFAVPELKGFDKRGNADIVRPRSRGAGQNAGLITLLIIVGIAAFLLGGGNGGGQDLVTNTIAEAFVLPDDTPAVKISWRPDAFIKGNAQRFQWQVYRSDSPFAPVIIAPGNTTEAVDDARPRTFTWYDFQGIIGGTFCDNTAPANPTTANANGVTPGTPYTYSVELVYSLSALDLPGTGTTTGGGTGTTGITTGGGTGLTTGGGGGGTTGLTTGGGTTGRTTGGGGGGRVATVEGEEVVVTADDVIDMANLTYGEVVALRQTGGGGDRCYFASTKVATRGTATPFVRPALRSPANNAIVATAPVFTFTSVKGSVSSVVVEYVLQLSDDPTFPKGRTITPADGKFVDNTVAPGAQLSTKPIREALTAFKGAEFVYWRIGARNVNDVPGPVPINGDRYVFSLPFRFQRPTDPPIPPQQ